MLAIARSIVGEDAAADVTQDAFLSVWHHPERFDPARADLGKYLRVVTRGAALDHARRTMARARREARDVALADGAMLDALQELLEREVSDRVSAALTKLRDDERHALTLAFYDQLTYREIAALYGTPEGTIKSRIRVGMKRLRSELHEHESPMAERMPNENHRR